MRCTAATTALLLSVSHRSRPAQMAAGDQDSGYPISPELRPADVLLRYFYDGGTLRQGRLCRMITPADTDTVSGLALLHALHDDGVDLECFYPCVRETEASGGSWLRFLRGVVGAPNLRSAASCRAAATGSNAAPAVVARRPRSLARRLGLVDLWYGVTLVSWPRWGNACNMLGAGALKR